jgi:lipopolysaccharide/colanic/teichoic acid biosynthesis glycosyltransferase
MKNKSGGVETLTVDTLFIHRFGEKAFVVIALLLASIPLAITALVILLALGKPLLFSQYRAGQGMRLFRISKFRTMHDYRDSSGGLLPDDYRQTSVTQFVRRFRFDELPQLFMIWRGDMAFVGPRPLLLDTIEEMGWLGRHRCSVRPGLTGWAQVNGGLRLNNAQKLALDIWYVDHRSVSLDLFVVLLTLKTLLTGERINKRRLAIAAAHLANAHSNHVAGISN